MSDPNVVGRVLQMIVKASRSLDLHDIGNDFNEGNGARCTIQPNHVFGGSEFWGVPCHHER